MASGQQPFAQHVYELLMSRNRGPGIEPSSLASSQPVGALAESWEISDDGLTITFNLRRGVKFQKVSPVNGRVMDIDDWRMSQERHLTSGAYRGAIDGILDKTEFPDQTHMVWRLKAPFAPIFDRIYHDKFAYPILPKELNGDISLAERTAIGTGYKIVDRYQPSLAMEYRKHPDYWGGDPFVDRWHQPIIPEYANRYSQFVNGNIIDFDPTAKDILLLHRDAPDAVIVAEPIPENYASRMRWGRQNPSQQPWADPRVRIAARRSIDFKTIGEFLSNKADLERNGISVNLAPMTHLPRNLSYWLDPEKGELGALSANYLYDPAEARKLTAAAGYNEAISLPFYVALEAGEIPDETQLVMDSIDKSGAFKLDTVRVPTAREHDRYRLEGLYDGLIPQSSSSDDADYFVMLDYHSQGRVGTRGLQHQAYPDPRMDALGEAQRREVDLEKRYGLLKDFQMLVAELMPAIPGRHQFTTFSFRWPWVHNLGFGTTSGNWSGASSPTKGMPVLGGHLHWLDKDMPNREQGAS